MAGTNGRIAERGGESAERGHSTFPGTVSLSPCQIAKSVGAEVCFGSFLSVSVAKRRAPRTAVLQHAVCRFSFPHCWPNGTIGRDAEYGKVYQRAF